MADFGSASFVIEINTCKVVVKLQFKLTSKDFTALHVMQTRYSDEKAVLLSVRLSVCPSVCQTREL